MIPIPSSPLLRIVLTATFGFATGLPAIAQEADQPPVVQSDIAAPGLPTPEIDVVPEASLPAGTASPDIGVVSADPAPDASEPAPALSGNTIDGSGPATLPVQDAQVVTQDPVAAMNDLSPLGMYMAAHWVVKAVMLSLAFACFVTWTILIFKMIEMFFSRRSTRRSARIIREADTLTAATAALGKRRDPAAFMAQAALVEYRRSDAALDVAGPEGIKERTRSILERVEAQAAARMRRGTGLLATIGSTAPFVGLFGTVWGIMNSFISIAETRTTNLAVVAPGIAEALLATAIGLVAAIPAVVIYNHFARTIAGYRLILGDAGAGVERLLSRDLDFRKIRQAA